MLFTELELMMLQCNYIVHEHSRWKWSEDSDKLERRDVAAIASEPPFQEAFFLYGRFVAENYCARIDQHQLFEFSVHWDFHSFLCHWATKVSPNHNNMISATKGTQESGTKDWHQSVTLEIGTRAWHLRLAPESDNRERHWVGLGWGWLRAVDQTRKQN